MKDELLNGRLKHALEGLSELPHRQLRPVPLADAREHYLVEGLHGLAAHYGREIEFTCINARGEMAFNIVNHGQYGADLARWLSKIPRRTGLAPTTAAPLPENGWCWINHFDVERLLQLVAEGLRD